ncbi:lysophospholipid acyltransferase family protein [Stratiformator vulcanicus]|uniref:Acyltransferase n=1 Tax=Stratiformator vulcanicus TaxID=2527980 RepID=A0A517R4E0_9PLAN|nr:lysophospholipid acyltransferase family protein [Stratiformator vulcanicus]QDT38738.1 Acyltransferase [Stratiformator vulcanicus]
MRNSRPNPFSYSQEIDGRWKRVLARQVENLSGLRKLGRVYEEERREADRYPNPWAVALGALDLRVHISGPVEDIPRQGPLVVIANHPFGVVDGMILCDLIARVRHDYRVIINRVLESVEDIRPYLLPIDFTGTKEATRVNLESRKQARQFLKEGGCVILFPAGGVSTSKGPLGPAVDPEWGTFAARLILQSKADVLPVYFHGQNSRLFQVVSQFSKTLRLALLAREVRKKVGEAVEVTVRPVCHFRDYAEINDAQTLTTTLRRAVDGKSTC